MVLYGTNPFGYNVTLMLQTKRKAMKHITTIVCISIKQKLSVLLLLAMGCSASDASNTNPSQNSDKAITAFALLKADNPQLPSDIMANVNTNTKTITLLLPFGTVTAQLVPTITISTGASVFPTSGNAQDFGGTLNYTVTAEDGSTVTYTVVTTLANNPNDFQVGDPSVTPDESLLDPNYPQMSRWARAGVAGGIPYIHSFDKTTAIDAGNSSDINAAIQAMANTLTNNEKGLITLRNGTYVIDASVQMKTNVSLIGESRAGVVCSITMNGGNAFAFENVSYCGIYNLTIKGSWPEPKYNWNYGIDENREFTNDNISVRLRAETKNCWLDKVTILNSAKDPLRVAAAHNTFRDLIVDGCKRKAGGAEGYFFVQGPDNLVTGCQITHIRHISLQGSNVEYNVVFGNNFRQEISFHSGDNGNNLIENNTITLPEDMPPIEAGETGPYPETENGKPIYFAIMGPWSTQHTNSAFPNFIYKNKCIQLNHDYGPKQPWSNDSKVYFGPKQLGLSIQERIDNFPEYNRPVPQGGTLYAIKN